MKKNNKDWLTTLKKILHFITTVLMYSICLIMIIVFLVFVVNFIDKQYNLKSGKNKKDLFSAYTIVSPSMVPAIMIIVYYIYKFVKTLRSNNDKDKKEVIKKDDNKKKKKEGRFKK